MSIARLSIVFSALTLSACSGAEADSGTKTDTNSDTGSAPAPGTDLNGSWATACYNNAQVVLTYADLAFTGTYTEYSDAACTDAYHISEWTGTAVVGDEVAPGIRKLDLAFDSFSSTALTEENAQLNNDYAYCGFTDWEAGVEKDVLGADCYGFSIPVGGKSLDIYSVEGDTLLFGVGAKIATDLTETDRPAELDATRVFTSVSGS